MANVTISSLAQQLGMSKASVSYALNGRSGVSEETRTKVLTLAAELGWYPNSSARALSQSRSETVGIVLLRDPADVGSEPFYMSVLAGIEDILGEREQNLMLRIVAPETGAERRDLAVYRRWSGEGRVDGVLLFDERRNDPRAPLLNELALPCVWVGGAHGATGRSAATSVDQSADALTVVQALSERGHRRIAYISGPAQLEHERARSAAVEKHASLRGISTVVVASDYTAADGEMATIALLAGLDPAARDFPTALVYGNDLMAVGGLSALKKLGLSVPEQVSVFSWDDSIMCQFSSPPVAALQRDIAELGRQSAALLLDIVQGHEPHNVQMQSAGLRQRASLGVVRPHPNQ